MGTYTGTNGDDIIGPTSVSAGVARVPPGSFPSDAPDTLNGLDGNDSLNGHGGNDTLNGGSGNDDLFGAAGNDILAGEQDDDMLYGGAGNDTLNGGEGLDFPIGGAGNDVMTGGPGPDQFEFVDSIPDPNQFNPSAEDYSAGRPTGQDKIMDFTPYEDIVSLPQGAISQALINGDTVLTHPGGTLTLVGVDLSSIPDASLYAWLSGATELFIA